MRNLFSKIKIKNLKEGFLLLELIISLGIFISVMALGMGAVLAMYGNNKKAQSLKVIMNNLNFSLDTMGREIAVAGKKDEIGGVPNEEGSSLWCDVVVPSGNLDIPRDCSNGGTYLTFCNFEGDRITYRFNDVESSIERVFTKQVPPDECPDFPNLNPNWQRVTSPEVLVQDMKFIVTGTNDPNKQPRVLVLVEGEAGLQDQTKSEFKIQTTLSQRIPDLSIIFP